MSTEPTPQRDDAFRALADPTRRRILRILREGDRTAGQLSDEFAISGPSMSHHFSVLKAAGLIEGRREGQQILYSLNTTAIQDLTAWFLDAFSRDNNGDQT